MYFLGWMSLAGVEVWNIERTLSYLHTNAPGLELTGCDDCATLSDALGDQRYKNNPADDPAPWVALDEPDLNDFYGFYPMSMSGLYDSTLSATITEGMGDGGFISSPRRGTKEIRVTGVLTARSRIALTKGRAWLINTLAGSRCSDGVLCNGDDMCFFADCPESFDQGDYYLRTVRDVAITEGPNIVTPYGQLPSGIFMDGIEFTMVAATPFIYGPVDDLGSSVGTPETTTGALILDPTIPLLPDCPVVPPVPVYDPYLPPPPAPPRPPAIENTLHPPEPYAAGYSLFIPKDRVPETLDAVLRIGLSAGSAAARWIRLRLYAAPLGIDQRVSDLNPCSFCGDITVTYIPPNSRFLIDGMNQTLTIEDTAGNVRPASRLAFSGYGQPNQWASITCGMDYWLTVEFSGVGTSINSFAPPNGIDSSTFTTSIGAWTNGVNDGSPRATIARDTAQFHNTPASMRVNWPAGSTDRPQVVITDLTVGTVYDLSMWVLSPTERIRLDLGTVGGAQSVPGAGWQKVTARVVASATTMMARLTNGSSSPSGDIWVDDFVLHDVATSQNSIVKVDVSTARKE